MNNEIVQTSTLADIAKALEGIYSHESNEQYWSVTIGHVVIVQALRDCVVSLKQHSDFYIEGKKISKNMNKLNLKAGQTLMYYTKWQRCKLQSEDFYE